MMFNPLLNIDSSSMSDVEIEEKIHAINNRLAAAYSTNSHSAINQLRNLLDIYINEQAERMEVQTFKEYYESDEVSTLTVEDDPEEEEKDTDKPEVAERTGGKLSLFRKVMNQQNN